MNPTRNMYFRQLAVKFGLRFDHHNILNLIQACKSHDHLEEASILERVLLKRPDVTSSVFISPFIEMCSEEELRPLHVSAAVDFYEVNKSLVGQPVYPNAESSPENAVEKFMAIDPGNENENPSIIFSGPQRLSFKDLQTDHYAWVQHNFPEQFTDPSRRDDAFLGLVEEVGELARPILKTRQGIRGTKEEHKAAIKDAVGDIVIFLTSWCSANGIDLQEAVETAWNEVKERDWKAYPETGRPPVAVDPRDIHEVYIKDNKLTPEDRVELTKLRGAIAMIEKHEEISNPVSFFGRGKVALHPVTKEDIFYGTRERPKDGPTDGGVLRDFEALPDYMKDIVSRVAGREITAEDVLKASSSRL